MAEGFLSEAQLQVVTAGADPVALFDRLAVLAGSAGGADDYARI